MWGGGEENKGEREAGRRRVREGGSDVEAGKKIVSVACFR